MIADCGVISPTERPGIRFAASVCALLVFIVLPALQAQQPAPAGPPSGQGAQVRTGTASGLSLDARIQNLLAVHQYAQIAAQLGQLPEDQAQLYRGILANRSNNLKASIEILEPLADKFAAAGDTAHEKLLRLALGEDYLRSGDLAKAAAAYATLETRLAKVLTPDEQDAIELPVKLLPLAKDNPPMTIDPCNGFFMQVDTDPLGLTDVPVFIDSVSRSWMFDPTAPFNLMDRNSAHLVGLKLSEETATIHTLTGKPIEVHSAVIPRMTVGGRLTLHNVTVFVFDNHDYYFPINKYQVEGVLGYPILSALGAITVTDASTIEVHPSKRLDPDEDTELLTAGSPFYLDGDQIIVALGRAGDKANPDTDDRMFALDAGGQQTYLTARYFDEHAAEFNSQQTTQFTVPGEKPQPVYVAETVPLRAGRMPFTLHFVRVLTEPLGQAALDDVYGILGVDALSQLQSYTFDYRTMRFTIVPEQ
jgi:hypothetical protein